MVSCKWFDTKAPDEQELLEQRLNEINLREVSSYPSIAGCDALMDKNERKECFLSTMAALIQKKLTADTLIVEYAEADTIKVEVTVFPDATLNFEPKFETDSTAYDTTAVYRVIKSSLVNFPEIEPAQKEGIPVTTKFTLPVVINIE
ncbi:hypothetical protein GCM10007424_06910 [Flavobacterium suaedae]|uniref:DUF4494 domain-containing protein n=1 Tax=Flavobacterium suaedae TaxID=1767027 RepID=A0ABQ1JI42_9FLAO|nr:hypothetical protein GCM10007424_06910 [Flavobacterium suaedae]